MTTTFAQLGVPTHICDALERRGITEPFEIQAVTIADTLAGRDLCGRAPTGSGKTLAFGVPLVAMAARSEARRPRSLVLAPTRELADQIADELRAFAGKVRIAVVYGGVGYGAQLEALRRGVDLLVACPGRLEDLIGMGEVHLDAVERVVLDEADRMADMGFMPAVRRLLDRTAVDRQTLLFSATLDGDVAQLTERYQRDPVRHEVGEETPDVTAADHHFWRVERPDRVQVTADTIRAAWPAIVFTRTRHGADRLAKQLGKAGVDAVPIHGGRSQNQRTRALAAFTKGSAQALVATDVAARGIHVDDVASVVHYDLPADPKDYVHRSGRTARGGAGGVVVAMVLPEQAKELRKLQRDAGVEGDLVDPDTSLLGAGRPSAERPAAERHDQRPRSDRNDRPSVERRSRRERSEARPEPAPVAAARGDELQGTVKFFDARKGFGFIERDGEPDLYVHFSNIVVDGYKRLDEGSLVEFDVVPGRKGDEAHNVRPVVGAGAR